MKHLKLSSLTRTVKGAAFDWQTTVKGGRALGAALARVLHLRDGGITARWYTATMSFAKFVVRLQRSGGWLYVVKYLKACAVLLQQSAGGQRTHNTQALGCAVARTRGLGIPRVIPAVMRKSIASGDPWVIRIWLTYFQLYRVIEIPGKLNLKSITDPSAMDPGFLRGWISFLNDWLPFFFREVGYNQLATLWSRRRSRTVTFGTTGAPTGSLIAITSSLVASWMTFKWEGISCDLKPKLLAILKGGPNTGGVHEQSWLDGRTVTKKSRTGKQVSCLSATNTGALFTDLTQWAEFHPELYVKLRLWLDIVGDRVIRRLFTLQARLVPWIRTKVQTEDYNPFKFPGMGRPLGLGKLGYKIEPAGKIRVFAMVDSITQCVMKPVHDLLFSILKRIEVDGTFDQLKPAKRLITLGHRKFWSLDLSSATDRFPLALQHVVLSVLIGPKLAELWASLLVERHYVAPTRLPDGTVAYRSEDGKPRGLLYGAGQPMGALTSWAAFSLTHHILVQFAAYRTGFRGFFKDYCLLGDDIVLANAQVALVYQDLLLEIGVSYGLAKSLISSTGGFEFAKRTFAHGKDVSALSLKAIGAAKADHSVLESVLTRFGVNHPLMETLRVASKVLGYGYRALARLPAVLASKSRLQGLAILLSRPGSPWGLSVMDWLLQQEPGLAKEVPIEVLQAIGERLWDSLKAKTGESLRKHREGLAKVTYPDATYGGNIDSWFDNDNLQSEIWNIYVALPLIGELKIKLKALQEDLDALDRPSLDDLNEIWLRIEEVRDAIASIPTTPNFFERSSIDFGGVKRSALIRTFRSVRGWLNTELARLVAERCLGIKPMAMAVQDGPTEVGFVIVQPKVEADPLTREERLELPFAFGEGMSFGIHPSVQHLVKPGPKLPTGPTLAETPPAIETPLGPNVNQTRESGTPVFPEQFVQMSPNGDGIITQMVMTPSGVVPSVKYLIALENAEGNIEKVIFTEKDIHLDGVHFDERISYARALKLLDPAAKARVLETIRTEQYEEM